MREIVWSKLSPRAKEAALKRPSSVQSLTLKKQVRKIITDVRKSGDVSVQRLTKRLDKVFLKSYEVSEAEKNEARKLVSTDDLRAMKSAIAKIERFHRAIAPRAIEKEVAPGLKCRREPRPLQRVGLYVPGGRAPLPSTVLMLGVPSQIAGCPTRALCSPPTKSGKMNEHIIVAAQLCGIERLYKIGGAQAIAALAYGTKTIPKVDKIFGPGNAWVTEAKAQVSQDPRGAAMDMPAGPSEVLVLADRSANPIFVAADLLSQAEHGPDSQVCLVTNSKDLLQKVKRELEKQLAALPRKEIAKKSLTYAALILVSELAEGFEVSNQYAPEHLILHLENANQWTARVQNAGSVFLGGWSPESVGDYASGTNHVLPTYGYAKAFSGLSVDSFVKQITFQELTAKALKDIGPTVERLASLEGLDAHRRAVSLRLETLEGLST